MADSPQPSGTPTTAAKPSAAAAVEESPVYSFLSNLSPIQPVKPAPVAQNFPGLNSPPLVFTSPRTNRRSKSNFLKRPQFLQSPSSELSGSRDIFEGVAGESRILDVQSSSGLIPSADKVSENESFVHDEAASPSTVADEFLTEIVNMNSSDSVSSEQSDVHLLPGTPKTDPKESVAEVGNEDHTKTGVCYADPEQAKVDNKGKLSSDLKPAEAEEKQRSEDLPSDQYQEVDSDFSADHAPHNQHQENFATDAGQNQRGIRRRCLHFGDAQQKTSAEGLDSINASGEVNCLRSPIPTAEPEIFYSSPDIPACHVNNRQLAKSTQPYFSPPTGGNSVLKVPKPSGIGLHLNSIVNSIQCGATVSMKSMESGSFSVRDTESERYEGDEPIATNSGPALTPFSVRPINPMSVKFIEQQSATCEKRKYGTVNNNSIVEGSGQLSQEKRRKKLSDASDGEGDGCKRCNCKRTKCLKLYCDCFAAGIYCAGDCACQGCLNRPEYEDTVLETRQQIESRNPLAFTPKIIQKGTEPNAINIPEAGTRVTPSSARHKRGCNCKKSMCLKKYCECYQSNVGCSDGCRCDGCKNVYGRKEEYGKGRHFMSEQDNGGEGRVVSFQEKLELVAPMNDTLQTDLCSSQNLTPITPTFEYLNHGKDGSKSWFSSGRFLPSPESATFMESYGISPGSSRNCDDHDIIQDSSKEILDMVSYEEEFDYGNSITGNEFSPRYHGPGSIGNFHHQFSPQDWACRSQPQLIPGDSSQFSSGSALHWRRPPISPLNSVGGNKFIDPMEYDCGLYNALEDDTPQILKESLTPSNTVKVSSPNKKRVSPPHSHLHGIGSSSSASLKTGRKYILKAVPSFPPLTPCLESKSDANQSTNDSQNCTGSQ